MTPKNSDYVVLEFEQRNLPGVAIVNSMLGNSLAKEGYSWHLSVLIQCSDLVDNRLPSPAEQSVLCALEESIQSVLAQYDNAVFLARVTHDGLRELIWRVKNPKVSNDTLQNLIKEKLVRPIDYRIDEDPNWDKAAWYLENTIYPIQ
jgi:Family of unknown function (DUF695)